MSVLDGPPSRLKEGCCEPELVTRLNDGGPVGAVLNGCEFVWPAELNGCEFVWPTGPNGCEGAWLAGLNGCDGVWLAGLNGCDGVWLAGLNGCAVSDCGAGLKCWGVAD